MARKLRIQFEGALYHVINRGNYRRDVFATVGAAQAFENTLFEAGGHHGWILHAHVVMRNHFHLAVETPRANLVEGMHWLQSTFATRFNRLRQERGHLFQGRYQALLIEDAAALVRVVDYIHLNPARARIVTPEQLRGFRWSSLRRLGRADRPQGLSARTWLAQLGWEDGPAGWEAYAARLAALAADEAEQKRLGLEQLSQGWAIGTEGWRRAIARDHAHLALEPGMAAAELRGFKEAHWRQVLTDELAMRGKTPAAAASEGFKVPWKIAIAAKLRQIGAAYAWIASELHMGEAASVRGYVNRQINSETRPDPI